MVNVLFLLIAYLLGSIPFSYLIGEMFRHQDLRKLGSGNLGATNAFREFGKPIGIAVSLLDVTKSGLLVFLMINTTWFDNLDLISPLYFGLASVIGHVYPVWFKFKGGKGVATSFGLLLAYDYRIAIVMVLVFFLTQIITRYVSVSSVTSAVVTLVLVIVRYFTLERSIPLIIVTACAVGIIIISHRSNFIRLKNGTERKVHWLNFLDKKIVKKKSEDNE